MSGRLGVEGELIAVNSRSGDRRYAAVRIESEAHPILHSGGLLALLRY